jgi:low temperature requirement protein LtrA
MTKRTRRRLELFLHLLTTLVLLLKGFDIYKRHIYFPAFIIFGLALVIPGLLFLWRFLSMKRREARTACYYIEAPALLIISYVLHLQEKEFLPHLFLIAAVVYPVAGLISSKKYRDKKGPRTMHGPKNNFH